MSEATPTTGRAVTQVTAGPDLSSAQVAQTQHWLLCLLSSGGFSLWDPRDLKVEDCGQLRLPGGRGIVAALRSPAEHNLSAEWTLHTDGHQVLIGQGQDWALMLRDDPHFDEDISLVTRARDWHDDQLARRVQTLKAIQHARSSTVGHTARIIEQVAVDYRLNHDQAQLAAVELGLIGEQALIELRQTAENAQVSSAQVGSATDNEATQAESKTTVSAEPKQARPNTFRASGRPGIPKSASNLARPGKNNRLRFEGTNNGLHMSVEYDRKSNRWTVLEGSMLRGDAGEKTYSLETNRRLREWREEALRSGAAIQEGVHIKLTRDHDVSSISHAASLLAGRTANGWEVFSTQEGVSAATVLGHVPKPRGKNRLARAEHQG